MNRTFTQIGYYLFIACCLLSGLSLQAQESTEDLKNRLDEVYGKEKLLVLTELTKLHLEKEQTRPALSYARRADALAGNIIRTNNKRIAQTDYYLKPLAAIQLGQVFQQKGRYLDAKMAFEKAVMAANELNIGNLERQAEQLILQTDSLANSNPSKKRLFGNLLENISSTADKASLDLGIVALIKLAKISERNENYPKAIQYYQEVIDHLKDKGESQRIEEFEKKIAALSETKVDTSRSANSIVKTWGSRKDFNRKKKEKQEDENIISSTVEEKIDESGKTTTTTTTKRRLPTSRNRGEISPFMNMPQSFEIKEQEIAKAETKATNIKSIAEKAEQTQDYETSLIYYKKYAEMEKQLIKEKQEQELVLLEKANEIDNQEREITLLKQDEAINQLEIKQNKVELERQIMFKQSLGVSLLLLGGILFMLYLLYRNKKREHNKLGIAYQDLEATQNQLKIADERIKKLLNQHLSKAVANELLASKGVQKIERRFVCVMFLDIRNFTPFVEKLTPEEIIGYQNDVFGFMMEIITKRKGIVNQIMGDGFMATFGAPVSAGNDCMEAYLAAQEIMELVKEKSENGEIPSTKIGIGLHAGHVVTGNVGTKHRKQFSVTGNAVITAARLEQLNKKYGSTMVLSKEVYQNLPEEVQTTVEFNEVVVKGRSKPVEVAAFY
ncbi:MAG: adenylate/guanylate cyclase domain-containing protein [Chitinophagales bacterium]